LVIQITALTAALGCGSDPEPVAEAPVTQAERASEPDRAKAGNQPPRIDDIRFEPETPLPGQPMQALVKASDDDGDDVWFEYRWRIDGRDASARAQGQDLDLADAVKGQTVEVEVVASDGQDESRPYSKRVELANRTPEIVEIDLEPGREVVAGTPVVVFPSGSDPDGDPLTYRYAWTVNGRDLRDVGALLETQRLRRGDEIRVRVIANDGQTDSEMVEVPSVVVVNGPPRVVSTPPGNLEGGVFRYEVSAQDPDGDPNIEFRLEGAPSGMRIDTYSGLITWTPTSEQAGVHSVTVFAEDMHEGVGEQVFEVRVSGGAGPAAPVADAAEVDAAEEPEAADAEPSFFDEDADLFEEEDDDFFAEADEEDAAPAEVAP
jgi:hypothetical protein